MYFKYIQKYNIKKLNRDFFIVRKSQNQLKTEEQQQQRPLKNEENYLDIETCYMSNQILF